MKQYGLNKTAEKRHGNAKEKSENSNIQNSNTRQVRQRLGMLDRELNLSRRLARMILTQVGACFNSKCAERRKERKRKVKTRD